LVNFANDSIFVFDSYASSLYFCRSDFDKTITSGLAVKRGLMELNKSICYSIVYPQVSEISNKNKIAAFK
jgi:hypothetical protein